MDADLVLGVERFMSRLIPYRSFLEVREGAGRYFCEATLGSQAFPQTEA